MAANKMPPSQLQRRGGRRISIPVSPTFLEKRLQDRMGRSEAILNPADGLFAGGSESPSVDLHMPPHILETPSGSNHDTGSPFERPQIELVENSERRQQFVEDHAWSPHVAMSVSEASHGYAQRPAQFDLAMRGYPFSGPSRDNGAGRFQDAKERQAERPSNAGRNMSTPSLSTSERSINEEVPVVKASMTKKSRLNLLNPMSLLARRRSSQNAKLQDVNLSPLHVPAIPDFDPSIRGNIVHDFSAPRVRTPRRDAAPSPAQRHPSDQAGVPPQSNTSSALYSPAFKEHFQDETALQPSQTAYLHNQPFEAPPPESLPPFAQKLPAQLPLHLKAVPDVTTSAVVDDDDDDDDYTRTTQIKPKPSLPPPPEKTPSPVYDAMPTMPSRRMKSTSSRFSFQISGHGSTAEEQLLEEKHRERYPDKPVKLGDLDDFDENDYNDYDFDAEGAFEEQIPGINFDYEAHEDEYGNSTVPIRNINMPSSHLKGYEDDDGFDTDAVEVRNVNVPTSSMQHSDGDGSGMIQQSNPLTDFHFTPQSMTFSPTSPDLASKSTPRGPDGFPIGIADTTYSPKLMEIGMSDELPQPPNQGPNSINGQQTYGNIVPNHSPSISRFQDTFDDADLYFDDGEFDNEHIGSVSGFDEDLLDDEKHIRDIPAENMRRYEASVRQGPVHPINVLDSAGHEISRDTSSSSDFVKVSEFGQLSSGVSPDMPAPIASLPSSGLTEGNLAAYHDALVMAANNAANSGRFNRQVSFSEKSDVVTDDMLSGGQEGPVASESRPSMNVRYGDVDDGTFGFDDDDDCFDDDLMIAEANAEALENDDEGFYGQEFGFYARAYGKGQSEFMNGGFFTSHGSNGVKRSHSGKAHFVEPSLTPITERSEWSARNSVVSLPFHNGIPTSAQSLPSPGLSQLLDSPGLEDEMTLSALLKLRRGAFGGSSTSINSMGERNMPSSSPLAHLPSYKPSSHENSSSRSMTTSHSVGGTVSIVESEEEDEYGDWPTLTQNTPRKPVPEQPSKPADLASGQLKPEIPAPSWKGHHSRNSSGAESVSYVRDEDGRWILERRRTGDDGELELIGREYLASARI